MAHHGPSQVLHHEKNHELEIVSQKIKEKATCSLLTVRAQLLSDDGRQDDALHDLEHALLIDEDYAPARSLLKKIKSVKSSLLGVIK